MLVNTDVSMEHIISIFNVRVVLIGAEINYDILLKYEDGDGAFFITVSVVTQFFTTPNSVVKPGIGFVFLKCCRLRSKPVLYI